MRSLQTRLAWHSPLHAFLCFFCLTLSTPLNLPGGPPKLGAVASESGVCSRIGTRLLENGGNAVDALVGTVFCLGTVAMYHCGIGGGGFALLRTGNGTFESIDFRETAPAAAFEDMFRGNKKASIIGGLASATPGEIRGLEYVHRKYGKLAWAVLIRPSVELARNGFTVGEDLIKAMRFVFPNNKFLTQHPSWAIDFAPHGELIQLGQTMTRKRYANTLETIANEGADAFYLGAIANATISALQADNGIMTLEDLKNYSVETRSQVHISYRSYKLTSCGAPSSGPIALSILNTVRGYTDFGDPRKVNSAVHRLDEAIRFGFGQRAYLGDPAFVDGLSAFTTSLLSHQSGQGIRSKISDCKTQNVSYYDPKGLESLDTPGTSHVVVADADGMAISLTTSVNLLFGSQLMVPETGVIMNNQMNDFSLPGGSDAFGLIPSPANFVRPGKRPLSSISPIIAETAEGKLALVIGAGGGSRIITAVVQGIHYALDRGMTVAEALVQPRFHDQLNPNRVSFEYNFPNATVAYMKTLGHNVSWGPLGLSAIQAVRRLANGVFEAAGEPRQKDSGGIAV